MNRDWVDKDFYKVLGLGDSASAEDIKRAYRKLAQKNHPDANQDDSSAEERFKQISEAYAVLGNDEKRKEYDEVRRLVASGGFAAGNPFGGGNFGSQRINVDDLGDLFGGAGGLGDLFGFGGAGGSRNRGPRRGSDVTADLHLSFHDAIEGVTTTVSVRGEASCTHCHGTGAEPGTTVTTCPTCRGAGTVAQNQGMFSFAAPCPQCGGNGQIIETPCSVCRGAGRTLRTRDMRVKIPAGVKNGAVVRVRGKGTPGANGGPAGDLLVNVHVARHEIFSRKGNHLTVTVPVTFSEAALGTKIQVPTMEGNVTLRVPAGTPNGKTFRVRGRGIKPSKGKPGDLLVRVEVVVPIKLNRDQKKLLEQLADHEDGDVRAHLGITA